MTAMGVDLNEPVEILLVEDNPDDAELTVRALTRKRLVNNIVLARDGAEAIDLLFGTACHPRVVLLDLKLPKIDGIEVLRRIRADERTRTTPVVVLTSSAEERDQVDAYSLGVNSYVTKPLDGKDFERVVSELGLYWMVLNRHPSDPRDSLPDSHRRKVLTEYRMAQQGSDV